MEIQTDGLDSVIDKIRTAVCRRSNVAARIPGPRGAPRATSLRKAISAKLLRFEPIITLASLFLARDVQIAVIGVQSAAPKARKRVEKAKSPTGLDTETSKEVREIAERPITPNWTRGYIDEWIRRPFLFLPKEPLLEPAASVRAVDLQPLEKRFRDHWTVVVLAHGQAKPLRRAVELLGERRETNVVPVTAGSLVGPLGGGAPHAARHPELPLRAADVARTT
jgi:hypothetical protein